MKEETVIYIISDQRSGSTLLENLLAKSSKILSVGEMRLLSDHVNKGRYGRSWGWKCSCGKGFNECVFWSKVIKELKQKNISKIKNTKIDIKDSIVQYIKDYPNILVDDNNEEVLVLLKELYKAIFKISGKNIIIDSSKHPFQGLWIYKKLGFQVKVINIKRDNRAVALSKQKWQIKFGQKKINLFKLLGATKFKAMKCNWVMSRINFNDKILINYEDLAQNPKQVINSICKKFDIPEFEVPEYMYLENDHTIAGTPNRFKKRVIKYDDTWKQIVKTRPFFRIIGKLLN